MQEKFASRLIFIQKLAFYSKSVVISFGPRYLPKKFYKKYFLDLLVEFRRYVRTLWNFLFLKMIRNTFFETFSKFYLIRSIFVINMNDVVHQNGQLILVAFFHLIALLTNYRWSAWNIKIWLEFILRYIPQFAPTFNNTQWK